MKKLVLSFAVIASMSLFACGGQKAAEEAPVEAEEVEVAEEVVAPVVEDSAAVDTTVAEAPAAEQN